MRPHTKPTSSSALRQTADAPALHSAAHPKADEPAANLVPAQAPYGNANAQCCPAFSLSRQPDQCLPTALTSAADGRRYPIDPDFRTVLACLRLLNDPDRSELDKLLYLAARFFLRHPPPDLVELFTCFVAGAPADAAEEPPVLDFEVDAGAIYASFRQQYGMDLLRQSLHWREFCALLSGLTEATPLGARIRLRTLEESRVAPEDRASLRRLKQKIAITPRMGQQEQTLLAELNRRLAAGEDPSEIIRQLQEV